MYVCPMCKYATDHKQRFDQHMVRKRPCAPDTTAATYHENPHQCKHCGMGYVRRLCKVKHESVCNGTHPLQCPTCKVRFMNRYAKSRHLARGLCIDAGDASESPGDACSDASEPPGDACSDASRSPNDASEGSSGASSDDGYGTDEDLADAYTFRSSRSDNEQDWSSDEEQESTRPARNVSQKESELVSFLYTDLEPVVECVLEDPARFVIAMRNGRLHGELCRATHFGAIEKNRNVFGVDARGTRMHVQHNGKQVVMRKRQGLGRIMFHNRTVASDPRLARYLTGHALPYDNVTRRILSQVVRAETARC